MEIGLEIKKPAKECNDAHCPFHNGLKFRGREFSGKVIRTNRQKTIMIEWPRAYYLPKYERYEKRRTRLNAHLPDCISVNIGDTVKIVECRPISKTKNFVVVEVVK